MFATLQIFPLLGAFIALAILYLVYRLYIKPYLAIQYYKKQGAQAIFYKDFVSFDTCLRNAREKGDFHYDYKKIIEKNPDTKFFVENFCSIVFLILIDPDMMKEFLQKNDIYEKDDEFGVLFKYVGEHSMVFQDVVEWKKRRKALSSAFNFEYIKDLVPLMVESVHEKFIDWKESGALKDQDLLAKMGTITGEVVGKFVFGRRFTKKKLRGRYLSELFQEMLHDLGFEALGLPVMIFGLKLFKASILPKHRELNKLFEDLKGACKEMIRETEEKGADEGTLMKLLLELRAKGSEGYQLTDDDIISEFVVFVGAGTETSAILTTATIYFLAKNPEVLKKVREEVDREIKDFKNIDVDSLNRLTYCTAVLKEGFRRAGPTGMLLPRVATKDDVLCGVKVKKGTRLNIFFDILNTSEKYFSNPWEFIPERWLPDTPESQQDGIKSVPHAFLPFSGGPRNCIGQHLAMIEAKIILLNFVKTWNYSFPESYKYVPHQVFEFMPLDPPLVTLELRKDAPIKL